MAWHDLLPELLSIIFQNIITNNQNFSDLYQCLAVCTSWRHFAKQSMLHIAPTPWLLLFPQKYPDQGITFSTISCKFHTGTSRLRAKSTLSFSPFDHTKAYASYDGWLLVGYDNYGYSRTSIAFLYNPLSGVLLQLPPFPRPLRLDERSIFVTSKSSPTDRNCVICVMFSINCKVVLAFCKPAPSDVDYSIRGKRCLLGSSSCYWFFLEEESSDKIDDVIFYRENFYTIDRYANLSVCNYDASSNAFKNKPVIVDCFNDQKVATGRVSRWCSNRSCNSLVRSKSGDLLMIKRIFHESYARVTRSCKIFKLNMSNIDYYYWSEISNLTEKEALFLGCEDCISVSVSDNNPPFKPNCIYFFDKYSAGGEVIRYGVYDMKTRTLLSYSDDNGVDRYAERYHCCRLFAPSGLS